MAQRRTTKKHRIRRDTRARLKAYSATAGAVLALGSAAVVQPDLAEAAVIYTDIPDITLQATVTPYGTIFSTSTALDLDNNGGADVYMAHKWDLSSTGSLPGTTFSYSVVLRVHTSKVAVGHAPGGIVGYPYIGSNDTFTAANALAASANVSAGGIYASCGLLGSRFIVAYYTRTVGGSTARTTYTYNYGAFPGQGDRYLGVAFDIDGNTHYGWVRLNIPADVSSVTIKDYAYENRPDTPIHILMPPVGGVIRDASDAVEPETQD